MQFKTKLIETKKGLRVTSEKLDQLLCDALQKYFQLILTNELSNASTNVCPTS